MKTRKYTTGLVVSFFFVAAIAAALHASVEAAEPTAASGGYLLQPDLRTDNSAENNNEKCGKCSWMRDDGY